MVDRRPDSHRPNTIISLVDHHLTRYPGMQPVDVYKLVYQCFMGVGHAVTNAESVLEMLVSEIDRIGQGPDEPLVDPISPSGHIVRVHLRPFRDARLDPRWLAEAFLETARVIQPDRDSLIQSWSSVSNHLATVAMKNWIQDLHILNQLLESHNCPAVHHSTDYCSLYRPAYRVIASRYYIPK